jgi:hypothetical protein
MAGKETASNLDKELLLTAIEEGNLGKTKEIFHRVPSKELPEVTLHIAANGPNVDVLEWLLQQNCTDVDGIDNDDGLTALHVAAMYGREEMIPVLLGYGANPGILDKDGWTPSDHAHTNNFPLCVKILKEAIFKEEESMSDNHELDISRADLYVSMATEEPTRVDLVEDDLLSEELKCMLISDLRQKLINLGEKPGPITPENRHLYLKYLTKVMAGQIDGRKMRQEKGYRYELALCLSGHVSIPKLYPMEVELATSCHLSSKKGLCSCFIYCLVDPLVSKNLPWEEEGKLNDLYCFQIFVSSVFYIGKGTNNRPLQHLLEANKSWIVRHKRKCAPSDKAQRIHAIWEAGRGVVSIHCFHNISDEEAHSREACMIDAVGVGNLTNQKRGIFYNVSKKWSPSERRKFGVYLLYKAMKVYMAEGERELSPQDLNKK